MEELVHRSELTNLPLSSYQKRLWIIYQLDKNNPAYNLVLTYHLKGDLDISIFQKAIDQLFERQHTMFSVFNKKDGIPFIDIISRPVIAEVIDFSDIPINDRREKILSFLTVDSGKCFDISTGPLYRLYLIKEDTKSYYFHATIHHLIFDSCSRRIFVDEFSSIYNILVRGVNETMEPLSFHSYDYALWEESNGNSKYGTNLLEFWKENLKGASPMLNFPYDFQRREQPSGRGSFETIRISDELIEKLLNLSASEGLKLCETLLGAFALQLHKYSGDDDINIGLPIVFRPHLKLENSMGMFVNTVVLRIRLEQEYTFRDLIRLTSEATQNAIKHQKLPFEKVVEIVNPDRSSNANPLFQVSFDWQNVHNAPLMLDGIESESISASQRTSIFDLTYYFKSTGKNIEAEIEYNTDILLQDTVIRLRDNFICLLQTLVENPDRPISEISVLSENDQKKLIEINQTESAVPDILVHNSFEVQAGLTPYRTAVIADGKKLTYQELDCQSDQLANYLKTLGIVPGDIVGVCMERSVDMVAAVLGILKAGCCYLPMDPSFPVDRIKYKFIDSGARALISQSSLKKKIDQFTDTCIILTDTDSGEINKTSSAKQSLEISSHSLAYMIFTSGSTGRPKGVKVHHQAVVNFLQSMSKKPGISKEDRLLAVTTLSFDISVLEIFLPLSFGAELIIAEADDISDGKKLSSLIKSHNITVMQATPSTWNILLKSGWNGNNDLKALCGGEAIPPSLVSDLLPKVKSLWNMYGPTETTVWSTCYRITDSASPILVGTPIDNTRVYILDKKNNQVPVGVVGEICIGGLGVTKGYNNRPELTNEKFIELAPGEIIYKTGDIGRFLIDGNIELAGRIDNQIKLRGFRIEPGEIESLLSKLPGVREAVVKVHKFNENDEHLVAFLSVSCEFKLTKVAIKRSLSLLLPPYMIPSFFQFQNEFPRFPNGKTDKNALKFILNHSVGNGRLESKPPSLTEKKILDIWREVLITKDILTTDNFFEIGGNSLLAITIMARVESQFNIEIGLRVFFDSPRIQDLAEAVDIVLNNTLLKLSHDQNKSDSRIIIGEI